MYSQEANAETCAICNGTDFYKEDGFYFCSKCQTQNDDIREKVFEVRYDPTTRLRKTKIKTEKVEKSDVIGWTSWELYNFVLIGISNELIQIGVDSKIKLTIAQLWTYYLSNLEVAFTSKTKKCVPKMARRYHKKDAEIIYGKIKKEKKRKRNKTSNTSTSSMMTSFMSDTSLSTSTRELNRGKRALLKAEYLQSQASSEIDAQSSFNQSLSSIRSSISQSSSTVPKIRFNKKAKLETKKVKALSKNIPRAKRVAYQKKHVTTQYVTGPDIVTPLKLWSIIYLALRIHDENIYISDMLRFGRETHLSYYKMDHLIPPEVALTKSDVSLLTQTTDITHKGLRRTAAVMAKFLSVKEMAKPDFLGLIKRYCTDLELPRGISLYAERLFLLAPSVMNFTDKSSLIPNYEGRAMAYVIVVLKILFSIDDVTEKEISRVAEKMNRISKENNLLESKLFSFCEWQSFLECRKIVLCNLHFPSKMKFDPEMVGTSHLYLRFQGMMKGRREAEAPEVTNSKHTIPQSLADAFLQSVDKLNDNSIPMKEMEIFPPSLTPMHSYISQLLENPQFDIPSILRTNFYETKVGYMTKPDILTEAAGHCSIKLDVVDRSLQYFEKIVPPFEQPRMPDVKELSELVEVETPSTEGSTLMRTEQLLDYAHKDRVCKLKIDFENFKHYSSVCDKVPELDETLDLEANSYFDQILPDGRLNISEGSDSEDEENTSSTLNTSKKNNETNWTDISCLMNEEFLKKYNITLYNHEKESLLNAKTLKEKYIPCRDSKGKFVKITKRNLREESKRIKKKEFKRILSNKSSSEDEIPHKTKKKKLKKTVNNNSENEIVEVPDDCFELPDSDISILADDDIIIEDENVQKVENSEILFRPFKNYWMYHCIFSRVKGKNFELFEKELPQNFVWLLNECSNVVEMSNEDLYEEVCLIEAYHLNILKTKASKNDEDYEFYDCSSKSYANNILNKW